jgi:hypothetical protein
LFGSGVGLDADGDPERRRRSAVGLDDGLGDGAGAAVGRTGGLGRQLHGQLSGIQNVIVNPPGAHIHNAPAGANGPVVHFLDNVSSWVGTTSGTITGDWRWDDATNPLTDLRASDLLAGNMYFNIHTDLNRGGEIRGQIVPEPTSLAVLASLFGLLALRRRR